MYTSDLELKKLTKTQKFEEIEEEIPDTYTYITTLEFNKLTKENFAERLKHAKLTTKDDIADFLKNLILM